MKRSIGLLFLLLFARHASATTYYLAPSIAGGNDSNNGLSAGSPWRTPNHSLNCGDVILAAAGQYLATDFTYGRWGKVNCPSQNNVAWLKCVTFDACKFTANGPYIAMAVTQSYWGVQGWEVTATRDTDACFTAYPPPGLQIDHIIFANNVANGCFNSGFGIGNNNNVGVDYLAIVGNIAYDASKNTSSCTSGIDIYQPVQSDSAPGTHIYIGGNFSWGNVDGNPCAGGTPTDGNGILLDTLDGRQGNLPSPYAAQILVENNLVIGNGGRGVEVFNNSAGAAHALIYIRNNTVWGNNVDQNEKNSLCGEITLNSALNVQQAFNIAATNSPSGCGAYPLYAYYVNQADPTVVVNGNVGWTASGKNGFVANGGGFSFGSTNLFGVDPVFTNPVVPGPPACSGAVNVPDCMVQTINNFKPTSAAATGYGYQLPTQDNRYDAVFPQWLCSVGVPSGLVTMRCLSQVQPPAPSLRVTIH